MNCLIINCLRNMKSTIQPVAVAIAVVLTALFTFTSCDPKEDPEVAGFHLTLPGLSLPESCPELPVLSALLDEGRLPLHQVLVVPDFT